MLPTKGKKSAFPISLKGKSRRGMGISQGGNSLGVCWGLYVVIICQQPCYESAADD